MSKLAKFIVLGGGVLGVLGFFLPLITATYQGVNAQMTTLQLVSGIDEIEDIVDVKLDEVPPEAQAGITDFNESLKKARAVFYALFAPAALLLLMGLLAVAKARMGRVLGVFAFLVGGAGIGIWALLQSVISEAAKSGGDAGGGIGMHLILVSGVLGVIAGLIALISPEKGYVSTPRHKATVSTRGV
jgi:hypothetical protein